MADAAAVSMLMELLLSTINEWVKEEISVIKNVKPQRLERVAVKLGNIQAVLHDAEKRSVTEETVKRWLDQLKDMSYEMDDVLDEWITSISKRKLQDHQISCSFFTCCISSPFKQISMRRDIGWKIKNIDENLESITKNMDPFKFVSTQKSNVDSLKIDRITTSIIEESKTYGREDDKKIIISKLLCEVSHEINRKIPIISIVGAGGLGKTTLAKLVFNEVEVVNSFNKRIWVFVSDPFDVCKVVREIIEAIEERPPNESSRNLLLGHLKRCISNVKFLLVLDDVWDEEGTKWVDLRTCLKDGMAGSRVLGLRTLVEVSY